MDHRNFWLVTYWGVTWIFLTSPVLATLRFLIEPESAVASRKNEQVALTCNTTSKAIISWVYNGKSFKSDEYRKVLDDNTLIISKVFPNLPKYQQHLGKYQCLARSKNYSIISKSASVELAVLSKKFKEYPSNVSCEENGVARFWCQIFSVPDANIIWEKNRLPLLINNRYVVHDSGILQINRLIPSDIGSYRCVAQNNLLDKAVTSPEGFLFVRRPSMDYSNMKFLSTPIHVETEEGHEVLLECLVNGYPLPRINWIGPDGRQIFFSDDGNFLLVGQGSILVRNTSQKHSGKYTCQATSVTSQKLNRTVMLNVLSSPSVHCQKDRDPYFSKIARIVCSVTGTPYPTILWVKDGKKLDINGRFKVRQGTELYIESTIIEDSGIYQCFATNIVGQAYDSVLMNVKGSEEKPSPPENLMAEVIPSGVKLDWAASSGNVLAYSIHIVKSDGGEERQVVSSSGPPEIIKDLEPYTKYTFYLRAYTTNGVSDQSQKLVFTTGEDVPLSSTNFELESVGPTSLKVTWDILPAVISRGKIICHQVQWKKHGTYTYESHEVLGNITEYIITGLQQGQAYDLRVLSATSAGYPFGSDAYSWIEHVMPEKSPEGQLPVPDLLVTSLLNSCCIKWFIVENAVTIDGFKLYYSKIGGKREGPLHFKNHVNSYTLEGLDSDWWYKIELVAFNERGHGDGAVQLIRTLIPDEVASNDSNLTAPSHIQVLSLGPTIVQLVWICSSNELYYTIKFHELESSLFEYIVSPNCSVIIRNLLPYTNYQFNVRVHEDEGYSSFSDPVTCKTIESPPGPPQDLSWYPVNRSTAQLSWQPPAEVNGIIRSYYLKRSVNKQKHLDEWDVVIFEPHILTTIVTHLQENLPHYFVIQAENGAGVGDASDMIEVILPDPVSHLIESAVGEHAIDDKPYYYLTIGLVLGNCALVIFVALVVWKCICKQRRAALHALQNHAPHLNGNGCYSHMESHEMDVISPMLQKYSQHDTKGGNPDGYSVRVLPSNYCTVPSVHS